MNGSVLKTRRPIFPNVASFHGVSTLNCSSKNLIVTEWVKISSRPNILHVANSSGMRSKNSTIFARSHASLHYLVIYLITSATNSR